MADMDMHEHYRKDYATKGVAGAGLGLGIAGTALSLLGGNGLSGLFGGAVCSENMPVSRYELGQEKEIAAKDAEIGLLKSQIYTDGKLTALTEYLMGQINGVAQEMRRNKDEQCAVNMQQAVYNGTNTAALGCLQAQVAALQGLTKMVIPNASVCPGWGNVTVAPAAAPTT